MTAVQIIPLFLSLFTASHPTVKSDSVVATIRIKKPPVDTLRFGNSKILLERNSAPLLPAGNAYFTFRYNTPSLSLESTDRMLVAKMDTLANSRMPIAKLH